MVKSRSHSANSLKILRQCEYRYLKRYVDELPDVTDPSSPAPFGKAVHKALEELYKLHKSRYPTPYRFSNADYDSIIGVFVAAAAEEKLADSSLLEEGRNMIVAKMDSFDYSENVVATEMSFSLTVNGVLIGGFIDKVIELDPDTAAIVDYKTSRMAMTQSDADDDIQLSMYDLAMSILYPQYKNVVLVLDYLRLRPVFSHRSPTARSLFVKFLEETDKYILGREPEKMVPVLNSLCGWCQFKGSCPAFIKASTETPEVCPAIDQLSDEAIIEKWKLYRGIAKAVDAATNSLKMQIEKLMLTTGRDIMAGSERLAVSQTTRVSYNASSLASLIPPEVLLSMCSVNKAAIERYLVDHRDVAEKVRNLSSVSYSAPVYRVSSSK